ncbi:MAG: aminopeptidase P family N-terminal domain-containing protein [Chloroflexi bacterium]|nr:aminopeptidase P family N-terminal domain-containing protein [Chloroflexota bacterium]
MTSRVELAEIELPEFGLPSVQPAIPLATYEARLDAARTRAAQSGYDALLVYGDREHFANLTYLTGYDPRFEEALLVLRPGRKPALLLGNEGMAYSGVSPVDIERVLYQSFSLLGQPRGDSPMLADILSAAGLRAGQRLGIAGWKSFDEREASDPARTLEIPAFIVDVLTEIVGERDQLNNATDIFMSPSAGLRAINDVDQLASFEFAATLASQAVRNLIFGVKAGMSEFEAVALMRLSGLPQSCHLMFSSGERAALGLASPSLRRLQVGDPVFLAYGIWGALNARGGWLARDADDLPADVQDYIDKLVAPYFRAIVDWYEAIGIGVTGGELQAIIESHLGDPFFGIGLNPGHLIHLDEWLHSPIFAGSDIPLRSGMALQVDVIPATHSPYHTTNIEDGIALADESLRKAFWGKYPAAWDRIQHRRNFMRNQLGIRLKPEALPFSNMPAYLPPFWLSPGRAMRAVD